MRKSLLFVTIILFSIVGGAVAQEKAFGIQFSGFVKSDFFWDTRQTVAAREGHFLLWPSAEALDPIGNDINEGVNFNGLAVQSRLSGKITGPDAFGAKTSGVIEGDFFAQDNANINLFRMRHAFVKLNWEKTELITGQYWNPLFVTSCFPGTVSFNTGTPFQSFARNPQIRLTQTSGKLKLIVAALAQRDFTSRGPAGVSSQYLRNAGIPDMHAQIHYDTKTTSGTGIVLGAGAALKTITPRLVSATGYSVDESVSGITAIGFAKFTTEKITLKLQGRYGENNVDVLAPSGFAVHKIENATTGETSYTPLTNGTIWGEVNTNGEKVQVGLFAGYLQNMGAKENVGGGVYGLSTNIASMYRVSPRVVFISGKTKIACELEHTSAAYGKTFDSKYVATSTTAISNTRLLLSAIYAF